VAGETFAQAAAGLSGRDDDEMIGEVERSAAFPVASEPSDRRVEDGCVPAEEVTCG
jgi:hypothetical protein